MRRRADPIARSVALSLAALAAACAPLGAGALGRGRPAYNAVINRTEDEQILAVIVRLRYDETFGMLAVTGVTASLRAGATLGADAGLGPREGYEGNLVPLGVEAAFEANPVISYVPLRGEEFVRRMLSPVSPDQALLLRRMSTAEVEVLPILVRRANGLANPLYAARVGAAGDGGAFERFATLFARLRERGQLDVVRSPDGEPLVLLHDFEPGAAEVGELLDVLGLAERPLEPPIAVPLRFLVGSAHGEHLDLETPSPLEILAAAGGGVDVPEQHLAARLARRGEPHRPRFLAIRSSRGRPRHAAVAVEHRGWWFWIDARDARSKQAFLFLRTLIGLRLGAGEADEGVPVLTVPLGR